MSASLSYFYSSIAHISIVNRVLEVLLPEHHRQKEEVNIFTMALAICKVSAIGYSNHSMQKYISGLRLLQIVNIK